MWQSFDPEVLWNGIELLPLFAPKGAALAVTFVVLLAFDLTNSSDTKVE
jgi:hypothetical protein